MTTTTKSTLDSIDWNEDAALRGSTEDVDDVAERPISEVVERVTEILGYDIFAQDTLAAGYADTLRKRGRSRRRRPQRRPRPFPRANGCRAAFVSTVFPRRFPRRGEIYTVDFNPARGSEQAGKRPAIIVSNDTANQHSPVVVVAAITSQAPKKPYPFVVGPIPAGILALDSMCSEPAEQIDKGRLEVYRGELTGELLQAVDGALSVSLALR